jgi:hypothetical protein
VPWFDEYAEIGGLIVLTFARDLPVIAEPDVLVCGAGCAGVGAAIGAARSGASTMVVERCGFAGGFLTAVVGAGFDGLVDSRTGRVVVGGVALEMIVCMGLVPGATSVEQVRGMRFTRNADLEIVARQVPTGRTRICSDPEKFKLAADRLLREAGVRVLYHTQIVDVLTAGSGADARIDAVVVANKGGLACIRPKQVVECTGDGDVAAWAGAPFDLFERPQPMSLHFRMGNVPASPELQRRCAEVLRRAHAEGRLGVYGGPWMSAFAPDEVYVNGVRIPGLGIDPEQLSQAEQQGREDAWRMFELWKEALPEFRDAYFVTSGPMVGVRETRRVRGAYTLAEQDVRSAARFEDVVVLGAWAVDRHPSDGSAGYHAEPEIAPYDIPYRTLLPVAVDNLLVAGRCHSATPEAAASSRVTITAMGMGQAAGSAAAIAVARRTAPREVPAGALQDRLRAQGAILDRPGG